MNFVSFLTEYWFQLFTGLFAIFEIIVIFIRRKPKSIDDFKIALSEALSNVPELVTHYEEPGHGEEKRLRVIYTCISGIIHVLGRKLSDNERKIIFDSVSQKIETVLSTPQKKESTYEKVK